MTLFRWSDTEKNKTLFNKVFGGVDAYFKTVGHVPTWVEIPYSNREDYAEEEIGELHVSIHYVPFRRKNHFVFGDQP